MVGKIKKIIASKGFGFIIAPEGEYFFHRSAVDGKTRFDALQEGDEVSFTVGDSPKGPRAENVRV